MFQRKRLAFFYAVSPVHMGSGTSLGVIDNPIQRERHTGHPLLAGSGLKGAARELAKENGVENINVIFGPETNASDHAGAVSFSDGQLVAFPVRSLKHGFVYAVSPITLGRLIRLANVTGVKPPTELPQGPDDEHAVVIDNDLLSNRTLVLESYEFSTVELKGDKEALKELAEWLSENVFRNDKSSDFFKEKLKKHLVLISDTQFSYFVTNSTVVEPHVRIDDTSGTADDGGLFFTENVPPESIFVALVMASQQRKKKGDDGEYMEATEIMGKLETILNGELMQIGGDATTGRGQVLVKLVGNNNGIEGE